MTRRAEEILADLRAGPSWERLSPEQKAFWEKAVPKNHPRGEGIRDVLREGWRLFGLFNHDPYIARISLIQEAGQQIDTQRQINAQQHAQDQDAELERAKLQGRAMADAMIERLGERGFKQ